MMKQQVLEKILHTYGVEYWGAGYFDVNSLGHLVVRTERNSSQEADVAEIVEELVREKQLKTPLLLRFPQLLSSQLKRLHHAYRQAAVEYEYEGRHFPVIPMKVNPRREVIETFLQDGAAYNCGVECGSKAELYAAISLDQSPDSLLICNGFKDESFIDLTLMGTRLGKRVVVVIEKLNELKMLVRRSQQTGIRPLIGLRAKLYSRGMGKWAASGGEAAKFGLTTSEILDCLRVLKEAGMDDRLNLLHFHIGSQITDIKRVKNAMKEAARVYAKIRALDYPIEFLDIGGGMGVDYDGSKTNSEASVNYTIQEFANDVLYTVQSVCEDEDVPEPNIVTESGRVMTSAHALFITSIWDEIETFADNTPQVTIDDDDPQVIRELLEIFDNINGKNFREYYHDALDHKDEMYVQFNLGLISLEDRGKGEVLFWDICARALKCSTQAKIQVEEFDDVKKLLASKYLCNFSLFRSAPDHWAIDQLFPIMPIHRLNELPTDIATMVDVTCDSDGIIDKFVDLKDVKEILELHDPGDEPYYLAIFFVGAYQEVMGSNHNLFGQPNEAHIHIEENGQYRITRTIEGDTVGDMIRFAHYDANEVVENIRKQAGKQVRAGSLSAEEAAAIVDDYRHDSSLYTYLENGR
ncbi:MAG TPA: biosynthetic arginine decarboxylase [Planctomycetaceae bacterium]|nr:biosynthetic arginine decarboxylase [Planctomycetaceae bacterium]